MSHYMSHNVLNKRCWFKFSHYIYLYMICRESYVVLVVVALVGVVIDVALFVALVDVGVVAVVGLDVDRGHGLEFLLLGFTYP